MIIAMGVRKRESTNDWEVFSTRVYDNSEISYTATTTWLIELGYPYFMFLIEKVGENE